MKRKQRSKLKLSRLTVRQLDHVRAGGVLTLWSVICSLKATCYRFTFCGPCSDPNLGCTSAFPKLC
ncbi:hypothetical protein LCGC14_0630660 [marine sediment metagenome]|uniref:Uncharacterized protein n=1 Tax=marine sediment metagenome TaxID=412755 RepID=A0A0F9R795_9ZZZZ